MVIEQDLDVSGRSFAREGTQRLTTMVREGAITTILTYRYDRLGRNLQQGLTHGPEHLSVNAASMRVGEQLGSCRTRCATGCSRPVPTPATSPA